MPIPKRIVASYLGTTAPPEVVLQCIRSWLEIMPDYEFRLITLANVGDSRWARTMLERGKFSLAAAWAKYTILHEEGGIHLGFDTEAVRRLDDLLDDSGFLGCQDENGDTPSMEIFAVEPGHPAVKHFLNFWDGADLQAPKTDFLLSLDETRNYLAARGWSPKPVPQRVDDITVYDRRYFHPYRWSDKNDPERLKPENYMTPVTYLVHRWWGSFSREPDWKES